MGGIVRVLCLLRYRAGVECLLGVGEACVDVGRGGAVLALGGIGE